MSGALTLLTETERYFHEKIPLTRAMGVRVEAYTGEYLSLTAPLEANHNHLGTAFGGSLSALATLAGYGMVWLQLGDRDSHVVIRDSSIRYRHPVTGILRAVCHRPGGEALARFDEKFRNSGKAHLELKVSIEDDEKVCMEFEGTYVAIK